MEEPLDEPRIDEPAIPRDLLAKQIASKLVIARHRDDDEKIDVEDDPEDCNGAPRWEHHAQGQPTRCEVREEGGRCRRFTRSACRLVRRRLCRLALLPLPRVAVCTRVAHFT